MRMVLTLLIPVGLAGCSLQPRFVPTGGSENPFVMFDNETARACYAGPPGALEGRVSATLNRADTDASLSTPADLVAYYFPENKGAGSSLPCLSNLLDSLWNATRLRWRNTAKLIDWTS
jgi:hypothetical protein